MSFINRINYFWIYILFPREKYILLACLIISMRLILTELMTCNLTPEARGCQIVISPASLSDLDPAHFFVSPEWAWFTGERSGDTAAQEYALIEFDSILSFFPDKGISTITLSI